jgi:hypothetical protein
MFWQVFDHERPKASTNLFSPLTHNRLPPGMEGAVEQDQQGFCLI